MMDKDEARELYSQQLRAREIAKTPHQRIQEHLDTHRYHTWVPFQHFVPCQRCGIVKNDKNKDNPCKGYIPVTMRQP
jgi:hypothetical protein